MLRYISFACLALAAAPVAAAPDKPSAVNDATVPVDRLYPEIAVSDEAWRGLLPVIMLDTEAVATKPATSDKRSESKD